jgi:hypothetical protein
MNGVLIKVVSGRMGASVITVMCWLVDNVDGWLCFRGHRQGCAITVIDQQYPGNGANHACFPESASAIRGAWGFRENRFPTGREVVERGKS